MWINQVSVKGSSDGKEWGFKPKKPNSFDSNSEKNTPKVIF